MEVTKYGLTLDDLQDEYRECAEIIGIDNLLRLSDNYGGSSIYIPQRFKLEKNKVYENIYKEFDGGNIRELVEKYGVCQATIYNIVKDRMEDVKKERKRERQNIPGQISIMDLLE